MVNMSKTDKEVKELRLPKLLAICPSAPKSKDMIHKEVKSK